MEYILIIVLVLWAISSYLYRTSKFKPDIKSLEEELAYKKSLLLKGVKIEQPKVVKSKPKPKSKFNYTDSTPEVDPKRQLMFISNAEKLSYMTTKQWKQLKLERLRIAQNKCESCGSTHNLHLHHITYERLTQELVEDVAILCGGIDGCHQKLHDIVAKQHPKSPYGREHIYSLDFLKNLP